MCLSLFFSLLTLNLLLLLSCQDALMDLHEDRQCAVWLIQYGFVCVGHDDGEKLWVRALGKLLKGQVIVKRPDGFVCPFCDVFAVGWSIRDAINHAADMKMSSILSWERQAEHRALEDYLRHHRRFAVWRAIAGFSM